MRRVVVDSSAFAAVVFGEDGGAEASRAMQGALLYAPTLLRYELQRVAWKKIRRTPAHARLVLEALERALDRRAGVHWMDPHPMDVVLLANAAGLSPYDASYLWLAGFLGADLITLDRQLAAAHDAMAIA
jgi:predicted nucleic acid-binding protein